jgi:hypothetical protein
MPGARCTRSRVPCPTFVTIAKRPSVLGRDGEDEEVIWVKSEPEYFCKGDWTGSWVICLTRLGKNYWAFLRVEVRFGL